jgi:hypothetical protein
MAKGRSRPKQPMYTPKQRAFYVRCGCDPKFTPQSEDEQEKEFQQKLTGGFNSKKDNICTVHFIARSLNGTCMECDY